MIISLPLKVSYTKKKCFYLNLNQYRNAHYLLLNNSKKKFKEIIQGEILNLPELNEIELSYTLFVGSKRKLDISNICSIIDKYFCDALVELGKLPDDNYDYIKKISYSFGGIDKLNPRCECQIICKSP